MNPDNRRDKRSNINRTAKTIAAIPIAGIFVAAAALMSGLLFVIGSETATAQQEQNATAANATAANATAANATGNQTATGSNQTGAAATATSGGNNNAGTTGGYP
jgi:flagellar basal body-associated protein FliL